MFILGNERKSDAGGAFERYTSYLEANEERFPPRAFALAKTEWYFDPRDHRCPHDAWLQSVVFEEAERGDPRKLRGVSLTITLLGAYHDGMIRLRYPAVFGYQMQATSLGAGHADWRYDELRVSKSGLLEHEIEWCGVRETGRWLIIADDVEFSWSEIG